MTSPDSPPAPPRQSPKKCQFSLRTMMIGTTGFAIFCGLANTLPHSFSQTILGILVVATTGWLVTGLFFARGDQRAFCIGAAIVVSSTWSRVGGRLLQGVFGIITLLPGDLELSREAHTWLGHAVIAITAVANGYFCIYARRYFERQPSS